MNRSYNINMQHSIARIEMANMSEKKIEGEITFSKLIVGGRANFLNWCFHRSKHELAAYYKLWIIEIAWEREKKLTHTCFSCPAKKTESVGRTIRQEHIVGKTVKIKWGRNREKKTNSCFFMIRSRFSHRREYPNEYLIYLRCGEVIIMQTIGNAISVCSRDFSSGNDFLEFSFFFLLWQRVFSTCLSPHLVPVSLYRFRLAGDLHMNYIQSGWYGE